MSISVNNSNSISFFFKQAYHANPGADKNDQHKVHIFQYIYFETFQIHLQVIVYRFEHINHKIHLNVLFQGISILFCMFIISISNIFHI